MNFVFDYFNGDDPIPNGIETGLRNLYVNDKRKFTKSSYIRFPRVTNFLKDKKFSKLDTKSKGLYLIQIYWPEVVHPTILNYIFNVCISPLALEKIKKNELKLVLFIDEEQFFKKNFYDLYDFLNRTFNDFTIYSLFKPENDDKVLQERVRHSFTHEVYLQGDKNYWFADRLTNNILTKKLKFNVLGSSRRHNLDFRVFIINMLLSNNFHKNAMITFDRHKPFTLDFTKNSNILRKQQKQIDEFDTKLYDNCFLNCDISNIAELTDISLVFGAYLDNTICEFPFVCEKFLRPVSVKLPFIYLGQYHSLKYIKSRGYKTFHPYINESYDNIEDNDKRMVMVIKETLRISNLKDHEYDNLVKNLEPIAEHNYNVFLNRVKYEKKYLESLCDA